MRLRALGFVVVVGCGGSSSAPSSDVVAERDASQASASQQTLARECDGGNASSCNVLAAMLLVGKGVAIDAVKARELRRRAGELFLQACTKGEADACLELPYAVSSPVRLQDPMLPAAGGEPDAVGPTMSVVVAADGNVEIDGQIASADEMDQRFAKACKSPELQTIVMGDAGSSYGRVVQVIDVLKRHGCGKYAFAAMKPDKPPPAEPPK